MNNTKTAIKVQKKDRNQQKCLKSMFLRNPTYPLPRDGYFSLYTNGDHDHITMYNSNTFKLTEVKNRDEIFYGTMPGPNIPALTVLLEKIQRSKVEQVKTDLLLDNSKSEHSRFIDNVKHHLLSLKAEEFLLSHSYTMRL